MGTNTLPTESGTIIRRSHVNKFKTALSEDVVPRDVDGIVSDLAASLGQSSNRWKDLFIQRVLIGAVSSSLTIEESVAGGTTIFKVGGNKAAELAAQLLEFGDFGSNNEVGFEESSGNLNIKIGGSTVLTIDSGGLATDSVDADAIAAGAVGTSELGSNAVTTSKIASGAVDTNELASSAVTTVKVADDAITAAKQAARTTGSSTGNVSASAAGNNISTLSTSLTTKGGPVVVALVPGGGGTSSYISLGDDMSSQGTVRIREDSTTVLSEFGPHGVTGDGRYIIIPQLVAIYEPAAGTYTYDGDTSGTVGAQNIKLIAYELF